MTHTPGPWCADKLLDRSAYNIFPSGGTCALLTISANDSANVAADARLIAAAPLMLKALQRITHPMADDEDLSFALEAIATATGGQP